MAQNGFERHANLPALSPSSTSTQVKSAVENHFVPNTSLRLDIVFRRYDTFEKEGWRIEKGVLPGKSSCEIAINNLHFAYIGGLQ